MSQSFSLATAKRPGEKFTIGVDFARDLDVGDAVASQLITATEVGGGDVTSTILENPSISGSPVTKLLVVLKAGTDSKNYVVEFKATTTAGYIFIHEIYVMVRVYGNS